MKKADNFKEFIEENFSGYDGDVNWIWAEYAYEKPELTEKFKEKILRIINKKENDR